MRKRRSEEKEPRKKKKHVLLRILLVLLIFVISAGFAWYKIVGAFYTRLNYAPIESVSQEKVKDGDVTNILLIGNDSRSGGEDGRSDAMILISISDTQKKIHMTSLLRDMYVEIPGYKDNRLNAAYSYGGPELLLETIEENLDIEVNRYVLVNFQAFAKLIDAVGGVELEVTKEEIEYINAYLVEYNMLEERPVGTDYMDTTVSGVVRLNGPQALAFSRNRYIGNDFGRTQRQRK
ncbi:MAG: LCP family protein, partial [Lachnospiraceae bacterium]|nr:LCP family protein [Lachnospiraceae bacterium]